MKNRKSQRDNIQVCVRIRPLSEREIEEGSKVSARVDDVRQNSIVLDSKKQPKVFCFDWIASRSSTQEEVFKRIGNNMVDTCLQGRLIFFFDFIRGFFDSIFFKGFFGLFGGLMDFGV